MGIVGQSENGQNGNSWTKWELNRTEKGKYTKRWSSKVKEIEIDSMSHHIFLYGILRILVLVWTYREREREIERESEWVREWVSEWVSEREREWEREMLHKMYWAKVLDSCGRRYSKFEITFMFFCNDIKVLSIQESNSLESWFIYVNYMQNLFFFNCMYILRDLILMHFIRKESAIHLY